MAKPIWAGKGRNEGKEKFNSALDRSWEVSLNDENETDFVNQGGVEEVEFTDSNDFFYLAAEQDWDYYWKAGDEIDEIIVEPIEDEVVLSKVPTIDGLGGADQLILSEEAMIHDGFFGGIQNITVLKLFDGKGVDDDYEFVGSQVTLGDAAQSAGIREVTGGPGDDVIDFSGYELEYELNDDMEEVAIPLEIIIKGGAGADEMTASAGNDTFIWKAGDMEGTNGDHAGFEIDGYEGNLFDMITDFSTSGEDVLDISELDVYGWKAIESEDDTIIQVAMAQNNTGTESEPIYEPADYVDLVLLVGVDYDTQFDSGVVIS